MRRPHRDDGQGEPARLDATPKHSAKGGSYLGRPKPKSPIMKRSEDIKETTSKTTVGPVEDKRFRT